MDITNKGNNMNHYTYMLTNKDNGRKYIGVRSCKCAPEDDIGYMSSSKYVKADGVENFSKVVLGMFDSRAEAEKDETRRLTEAGARNSEEYYNRCHGAEGFSTSGLTKHTSKMIREKAVKQKLDWEVDKEAKVAVIHHQSRDYTNHEKSLTKGRGKGKSRLKGIYRTEAQKLLDKRNSERMHSDNNPAHSAEAQAKRIATVTGRKRPKQAELMKGRISIGKDGVYKSVKEDDLQNWLNDGWIKELPPRDKYKMNEKMCPHCGLTGKGGNMTRYHFDNCNKRIINE